MFAGDCDILEENRGVSYSLGDIQFDFIDPNLGYTLDSNSKHLVDNAFSINSTGAVTPMLTSYRPFSFGRFVLTVVATDTKGRTDTSELKVCILCSSLPLQFLDRKSTRPVKILIQQPTKVPLSVAC